MAELVYRSGSGGEERFALSKEVSSVGRDEDCDVILPDTSVSRRHALIYRVDERLCRRVGPSDACGFEDRGHERSVVESMQHVRVFFGDDAHLGHRVLGLTLAGRSGTTPVALGEW